MLGELNKLIKKHEIIIEHQKITPLNFKKLLDLIETGSINNASAKIIFEEMFLNGDNPEKIANNKNLIQTFNADDIEPIIKEILQENPKAISDFLTGNENVVKFLLGQVMKNTKGKANPKVIEELLINQLRELNNK